MKKASILLVLLFLAAFSAWSISFIGVDTGLLFLITTEGVGAPNPVILQGLGITVPLVEEPYFFMHAGLLLYGCQYLYSGNRAIPADNELANTLWTIFPQLDLLIGFPIKLSDSITIGAALGPSFIFPLPLFASDLGDAYRSSMFAFFYNNLRIFYAQVELLLRWAIVKGTDLTFKVRGLYDLATLWDDPAVNRWNGFQVQALISLEVRL
jgi:hypothetical protein